MNLDIIWFCKHQPQYYGQENIYTKLSNLFDEYDYKFHKDKLSLHLITQRDDFSYSSDEYSRIKSCGLTS